MLKKLTSKDKVIVSIVPDTIEIGEVSNISKNRIIVRKSLSVIISEPPYLPRYREFYRNTGVSIRGEEFGKILQEDDLAIKEVAMVCPYTSCGKAQRNFFMAKEFLQGGKNCNCFYCKKLIWLNLDGSTKKVTVD